MSPPRHWTAARILQALRLDARRRGRAPTMYEWERAVRGKRPCTHTVVRWFGNWNRALEQAGLEPRTGNLPRSRCARGHELTGIGACRACQAASRRRYQARRRRRLTLAGLCTTCGGERDDPDHFTCSLCRAGAAASARRRRAEAG